jgi:hypothetical protein
MGNNARLFGSCGSVGKIAQATVQQLNSLRNCRTGFDMDVIFVTPWGALAAPVIEGYKPARFHAASAFS